MSKNDGGPAFPRGEIGEGQGGMTLRDYFAGQALQMIVINDRSDRPDNFRDTYSAGAYLWADAMIAARDRGAE